MIEISDLSFTFPNAPEPLFSRFHFHLGDTETVSVMGPSGCGKSTLLRLLLGLEKAQTGRIERDGHVSDFSLWDRAQTVFSLVPQEPRLLPWKTVFENVVLGLAVGKSEIEMVKERAWQMLKVVGLETACEKYPYEISAGMAQRVSFARALAREFKILLLDEPFAALDPFTRRSLQDWLREELTTLRIPAIFVTHDLTEATLLGSRVVFFSQGGKQLAGSFEVNFENKARNVMDDPIEKSTPTSDPKLARRHLAVNWEQAIQEIFSSSDHGLQTVPIHRTASV